MWVVPETVYNAEINFPDDTEENQTVVVQQEVEAEEIIYISREKILEFAKILNEAIDTTELEAIDFIERIPLGMYAFTYESKEEGNAEGNDVSYQVMVYNSTEDAYKKFMEALPELFEGLGKFSYDDDSQEYLLPDTLERLLKHCKENFFSGEMIPPYYEDDIKHILEYYAQKGACPKFYTFAQVDREKLDVAKVAQNIWNEDMGEKAKANYLNDLWNNGDKDIWRIFFVYKRYFLRMVEIELTKLAHPEIYADRKKPKVVDFKTVDDLLDKLANSTDGKMAIKSEILDALSKLKERAQQNRDADNMKKVGEYYGKIHEHDEENRCYSSAEEFKGEANQSSTIITPPVKPSGEPIPDTNLTWRLDDDGTLTISGKGDMKNWVEEKNPAPWYGQRTTIKKVIIEDGVTFIGGYAFEGCESLTNVTLPENITTFGEAVFVGCTSLKKIDQPSKVISCDNSFVYEKAPEGIRINSFIGTTPTVSIPRSVTSIGASAFEFCESLINITIPPNITKIWGNIFYGCSNLKTIRYTKIYRNRMETLKRKLSTGNDAELILY